VKGGWVQQNRRKCQFSESNPGLPNRRQSLLSIWTKAENVLMKWLAPEFLSKSFQVESLLEIMLNLVMDSCHRGFIADERVSDFF
jgi:hypothetical protein